MDQRSDRSQPTYVCSVLLLLFSFRTFLGHKLDERGPGHHGEPEVAAQVAGRQHGVGHDPLAGALHTVGTILWAGRWHVAPGGPLGLMVGTRHGKRDPRDLGGWAGGFFREAIPTVYFLKVRGPTGEPEALETRLVGRVFHETVSGSLFLKGGTDGLGSQTATVVIQSSHLGIDDTDIHGRRGTRPPP